MLTSIYLHAHAAGGSERRYNRRRHRCNDLHNKLKCLFLCHGLFFCLGTDFTNFTDFVFVISTKRSAWRDLSTTLEMTGVEINILFRVNPCNPCLIKL